MFHTKVEDMINTKISGTEIVTEKSGCRGKWNTELIEEILINKSISVEHVAKEWYSASIDVQETVRCFFDNQGMGQQPR